MTAALFITLVGALAAGAAMAIIVFLRNNLRLIALAVLVGWLSYAGMLGYMGVLGDSSLRPPGTLFLMAPLFLFVFLVLVRSSSGAQIAAAFPLQLLIGAQLFRVPVELFLHRLWLEGLAPKMLTYEGANFDIVIGLSAPLVAFIANHARIGRPFALFWSIAGLISLANVATRALLTAPGPLNLIHAEVPNLAIGTFPFSYIPGFLAPLALILHVLALRDLSGRRRASQS